jgi:ribosomal-protein-alanine N-acetyltransferase
MMSFVSRLLSRGEPAVSEARQGDAAAIAAVHSVSFQRGWGEDEIHRLLLEKSVVAHRVMSGRKFVGFILSRHAAGEAEILSVAIAPAWRGRGASQQLLILHLRRLAGLGVRSVFLEVGEQNTAACTDAPVFTKWAAARAITTAAPPRWCCAAILADVQT